MCVLITEADAVLCASLHGFSIAVQFVSRSVMVTSAVLAGLLFLSNERIDPRVVVSSFFCAPSVLSDPYIDVFQGRSA